MSKRTKRKLTDEERAQKRADERELMAAAIEELRSIEGWRRWLEVRHRFHSYSFRNQLLIAYQCPTATRVAGYDRWKKLGYQVQRGEAGISIWAHCSPSKKVLKRWRDEGADPDTKPRGFYRMVRVFDRAQVAPIPEFPGGPVELDPPIAPLQGDSLAHLLDPLIALAGSLGVAFEVVEIPGAANGFFEPGAPRIAVRPVGPDFSANQQVKTAIHEDAHALIHLERAEDDPKLTRAEEEVAVECVAYTVCSAVGFDSAGYSVPYMTSWSDGHEIELFGELIDRVARRLEAVVLEAEEDSESSALIAA